MNQKNTDSKKDIIVEAAVTILIEKGVAHTSMNDIVRVSGMSKGGVYHYFDSKDDLLVGVMDHFYNKYVNSVELYPESEPSAYERLKCLISGHEDLLVEMGNYNLMFLDFFSQAARIPKLKDRFKRQYNLFHGLMSQLIQEGVALGEFKNSVKPAYIASGLIGIFDGIGCAYLIAPDTVDYPRCAVVSAQAMIEGIRT